MSHTNRTSEQQRKFYTLKHAIDGDGESLDDVITVTQGESTDAENLGSGAKVFKDEVNDVLRFRTLKEGSNVSLTESPLDVEVAVTIPPLVEQYYKNSTPATTGNAAYTELDDNDFTIIAGDYWVDVVAIYGGDKFNKDYGFRVKINGNVVGELLWRPPNDEFDKTLSLIEELTGLGAGTLNVSIEGKASSDNVGFTQWAVRLRKK